MAKITEIDYDQMIQKASNIASTADAMQKSIQSAMQKVDSMRNNWFGNSYDIFVDAVNMCLQPLNDIFFTTVSEIPHEIAAKAKSYAKANQTDVSASMAEQEAITLTELTRTNKGSKVRFQSSEVTATQGEIKSKFEEAANSAEKASSISDSLSADWDSISGDSNIKELKAAFGKLKLLIDALTSKLDSQVTAQASSIEAIETAANAVEAVVKIKEDAVDAAKDAATNATNAINDSANQIWKNLLGKN